MLESMERGDFGECDQAIATYKARCHLAFPYAIAFQSPPTVINNNTTTDSASLTTPNTVANGGMES